jgi:hypothetical protein
MDVLCHAVLRQPMVFEHAPMDDSKANTPIEKDIVEVAKRKDCTDDPMHADGKFRDVRNGTDAITNIQRLWLHHPISPPRPSAARMPVPGMGVPSVYAES